MDGSRLHFVMPAIVEAAHRAGLDPSTVAAICVVESNLIPAAYRFEPKFWAKYCAPQPKYAGKDPHRIAASYGLMQVMYPTAETLGYSGPPEMLCVPEINLHYGCSYLARLLRAFKTLDRALAAYNAGPGRVDSPEGAAYAKKVRQAMANLPVASNVVPFTRA